METAVNGVVDSLCYLEAIKRSQAAIEFDLLGTILDANSNFLTLMGYTLEEIKGQSHSMFVDPDYRRSGEYRRHWEDLNQGEFKQGEFPRRHRDGRTIWLEATYCPVLDRSGKLIRVLKIASEITQKKLASASDKSRLEAVERSQAMIEFDASGVIVSANANFLSTMGYSLDEIKGKHHRIFVDSDVQQSQEYDDFWRSLREGKFFVAQYLRYDKNRKAVWLQASYNPIFDLNNTVVGVLKIATDISDQKRAESHLQSTMETVAQSAESLARSSASLDAINSDMESHARESSQQASVASAAAAEVSSSVSEVSRQTSELRQSIDEISRNAQKAASFVTEAVGDAELASDQVVKLGESGQRIRTIVKTISAVAEQTNLLALNATIEAARAGEAGKGFAVVAGEVKELAKTTALATTDISKKIADIEQDTAASIESIQRITQTVRQISQFQEAIAAAVEQQAATTSVIVQTISHASAGSQAIADNVAGVAHETAMTLKSTEKTREATRSLSEMANRLESLVAEFAR